MKITDKQLTALVARLSASRVKTREQGRQTLSYLEAWDVKASLIRIFGFGGFSAEVIQSEIVDKREVPNRGGNGTNWKVSAQATVRLTIHDPDGEHDAVYTETAIAGSSQPDITESLDMALKSAESDALKRAAIYLGTQFGLSLYDDGALGDVVRKVFAPGQEWPKEEASTDSGQDGVDPVQAAKDFINSAAQQKQTANPKGVTTT